MLQHRHLTLQEAVWYYRCHVDIPLAHAFKLLVFVRVFYIQSTCLSTESIAINIRQCIVQVNTVKLLLYLDVLFLNFSYFQSKRNLNLMLSVHFTGLAQPPGQRSTVTGAIIYSCSCFSLYPPFGGRYAKPNSSRLRLKKFQLIYML